MDPCEAIRAIADRDAQPPTGFGLCGNRNIVAVVNGLVEAHIHRAVLQPGIAEIFERGGGQVAVNGNSRNQAASEPKGCRDGIVVNFVFRFQRRIHSANAYRHHLRMVRHWKEGEPKATW